MALSLEPATALAPGEVATAAAAGTAAALAPATAAAAATAAATQAAATGAATGAPGAPRVVALLACHDRRAQTLAALAALAASAAAAGLPLRAVLVDDGSRDGTAAAVRAAFGWVEVLEADGSLYWCRAMHRAFARALEIGFDACLWLNDDTELDHDALTRLAACAASLGPAPAIVAGSVRGSGGLPSYGGRVRRSRWRRTAWRLLAPAGEAQAIEVFDGNLVWVGASAAARVGNLDAAYEHAMGDTDYALRAAALGVALWLAPGTYGRCDTNPVAGTPYDRSLPLARRWRAVLARKGLPWRSWLHFCRRHGGAAWPLYFAWPYLRVVLNLRAPSHA